VAVGRDPSGRRGSLLDPGIDPVDMFLLGTDLSGDLVGETIRETGIDRGMTHRSPLSNRDEPGKNT
jgi:hypothetical protein